VSVLLVNVVVDVADTAGAQLVQSVPLLVSTFPLVQGATLGTFLASFSALLVTYLASSVQVSTSLPAAFVIVFCLASSQDFNRFTVGYFVVLVSIVEFSLLAAFSAVYHNAACLPLNVLQSAALNTHLLLALAVGTLSVITGVVVQLATDEDKSVQVVHNVKAATDVTVQLPTVVGSYSNVVSLKAYTCQLVGAVVDNGMPKKLSASEFVLAIFIRFIC
jgi:hypothetical protein